MVAHQVKNVVSRKNLTKSEKESNEESNEE